MYEMIEVMAIIIYVVIWLWILVHENRQNINCTQKKSRLRLGAALAKIG